MHPAFRISDCRKKAKKRKKRGTEESKLSKFTWANRQVSFSIIFYCFQLSSSQIWHWNSIYVASLFVSKPEYKTVVALITNDILTEYIFNLKMK